ncbi:MAG: hypothetical protein AMXMBFR56_18900 [Polyangiaceae bacterium]
MRVRRWAWLSGVLLVWTAGCGGDDGGGGSGGSGTGGSATGGAGGSTGGAAGSATGGAGGSTGGAGGSAGSSGTACKGEPYSASCKMNDGSSCIDYHGATWTFDIVKQGCEVGGKATVSTTKCALTGTVGGCEHYIAAGTCDVTHYFAPVTTGVAQSTCTGSGGTFYPP